MSPLVGTRHIAEITHHHNRDKGMASRKDVDGQGDGISGRAEPISLAPLDLASALSGLLAIPDPEATKPKRKKAPPTPEKD